MKPLLPTALYPRGEVPSVNDRVVIRYGQHKGRAGTIIDVILAFGRSEAASCNVLLDGSTVSSFVPEALRYVLEVPHFPDRRAAEDWLDAQEATDRYFNFGEVVELREHSGSWVGVGVTVRGFLGSTADGPPMYLVEIDDDYKIVSERNLRSMHGTDPDHP